MTSEEYVRSHYKVPAKVGMRVIANGYPGVITSFVDSHIVVRLDGDEQSAPWHPTWRMVYLGENGETLFNGGD